MMGTCSSLRRPWWLLSLWYAVIIVCVWLPVCWSQKAVVNLPFGDINVLVVTDVHSWIGGHRSESRNSADYGDILSFYQRLKSHCQDHGMDLWFVMNGDWIDGTGLSMNGDISYLTPLLEKMPWDAVNCGNHEIYRTDVVNQFMRPGGFVESWGDRYLTSNVMYAKSQQPLGYQYRFLRGKNATVLTFGFLYNMEDASELVTVEKVESVVEERWFVDVVTNANGDPQGNFDAIMVLAHMDVKDLLVTVLLNKIRSLVGDTMPVQFITGHTHYRGIETMDTASVSFEAGRYLDTVGFVSFPTQKVFMKVSSNRRLQADGNEEEMEGEIPALLGPGGTEWPNASDSNASFTSTSSPSMPVTLLPATIAPSSTPSSTNSTMKPLATRLPTLAPTRKPAELFHHVFIDANVATLEAILGVKGLATDDGIRLSEYILRTRSDLGLLEPVGCSPQTFYLNRTVEDQASVWKLFLEDVALHQLLKKPPHTHPNQQRMFLGGSGVFRYDMVGGPVTKDDVIAVSPFNESIWSLGPTIPGSVVIRLVKEVLNAEPNLFDPIHENFMLFPSLDDLKPDRMYEIMAPTLGVPPILNGLKKIEYNETVKQVESKFTSTDIWLDYVKDKWVCEVHNSAGQQQHAGGQTVGHSDGSSQHTSSSSSGGHDKGVSSGSPQHESDPALDERRQRLALVAVVCVLILGTFYIWQLHRSWSVRYRELQRNIYLADSENDNELI